MRKTTLVIVAALAAIGAARAQEFYQLRVTAGGETAEVACFQRNNLPFVSAVDLARKFKINYYENEERGKVELKFPDHTLKLTAKNTFVVLTPSGESSRAFQIPVRCLQLHNELFFPIPYLEETLERCFGGEVSYDPKVIKPADVFAETTDPTPSEHANEIVNLAVEEKRNGALLRIELAKPLPGAYHVVVNNTLKLVLADVAFDPALLDRVAPGGVVTQILGKTGDAGCELYVNLSNEFGSYEVLPSKDKKTLLITLHSRVLEDVAEGVGKERWVFDTIVLDPGHGGVDPGAVSGSLYEKDINLDVSLKIGDAIEREMPDVRVAYTRETDVFVELHERGKIANEKGGKLFLSVHCNATPDRSTGADGVEFYLLRPGRTQEAVEIAEFENSVVKFEENPDRYEELTVENFIFVSMARSAYMQYSEKFAEYLDAAYREETSLRARGVKQAGFWVLVGASMPSVLVELGFITNPSDAAYLRSERGQEEMARATVEAIKEFREYYDRVLQSE